MEASRAVCLPVREFAEAVKRTGYERPWCLEIFNDSLANARKEVPDEHARRGIEGLWRVLAAVGLTTGAFACLEMGGSLRYPIIDVGFCKTETSEATHPDPGSKESTSSSTLHLKLTRPVIYRGLLLFPAVASLLFLLVNTFLPIISSPSFPRMPL
jgi:hypothetical protein